MQDLDPRTCWRAATDRATLSTEHDGACVREFGCAIGAGVHGSIETAAALKGPVGLETPMPAEQALNDGLGERHRICLSLLCRRHLHEPRVATELHVVPASSPFASSAMQPAKIRILAAEEGEAGGLLPWPPKGTLVDIDHDAMAPLEDPAQPSIVPHVRVPRLLQDSGRVGSDTIIENVQSGVQALIPNAESPAVHFPERLSPTVMRETPWSSLRPDRAPRPIAGRRKGGARRSEANSSRSAAAHSAPDPVLHLRTKHITMFSMPQLEFVRCGASSACTGRNMPDT